MTENTNNQIIKVLGSLALWIVCGLILITSGSIAFMIIPIIYPAITARRNQIIKEMNKYSPVLQEFDHGK